MEPNYLAYAQAVNAGNPMAEGMKQLAATIEARRERERLAPQEAQATSLRNLQIQQAQAGLDESTAKRTSLVDQYGTKGQPDEYARAMSFQAQEAKDKEALAVKQKGMETYLNTVKALDGMTTLDAATKTEISKHFLSQNPEYAEIAKNLNYVDSKGVEATRQFNAGELKDPATGQPLPAGFYKTKGVWTGDAANPVKLISYEAVAPPKTDISDQPYKLGELKEFQNGRTKVWKEYTGKNQWKDRPDLGSATVDRPPAPAGTEPVAQTTFVDAETGKPLVFDKKTGTYRIANVEGGVAPKPGAMSPEQATRAQQFETVITNIPKIRGMVLDKNGNIISKLDIANSQVGTWGTKGRQIRQEVKRTVEQALRIATGAAAPDSEVANYTDMYAPQVGDTKEQIAEKFKALETFAEGTRAKFNVGRSPQAINQGQGKAAPAKGKAPVVTKGGFKVTVVP